jgi:hypothetical protein
MSKKVGLAAVIVTLVLTVISIYIWYNLMVLNTDYGDYYILIRVLAIGIAGAAVLMAAGCYAAYMNFSQEDLEKIGDDATKK